MKNLTSELVEEFRKQFWLHRVPKNTKQMKDIEAFMLTAFDRVRAAAIEDCINALPVRSDWDDDEKVTAKMVMETSREALNSFLEEAASGENS